MDCSNLIRWNFSTLFSLFGWFGYILKWAFYHQVKFYSFMFMNKISTGGLCKWVSTPGLPESSPGPGPSNFQYSPTANFFLHLVHIILKTCRFILAWFFFHCWIARKCLLIFQCFFSYSEKVTGSFFFSWFCGIQKPRMKLKIFGTQGIGQ